MIAKVKNNHIR